MPNDSWAATTYHCKLNATDYTLTQLVIDGYMEFQGVTKDEPQNDPQQQNTLVIFVDGSEVARDTNNLSQWWQFTAGGKSGRYQVANGPTFSNDDVTLTLGFWDGDFYRITVHAELSLSDEAFGRWQASVFKRAKDAEQQKVDKENQELQLAYNAQMSTYPQPVGRVEGYRC